MLIPRFLPRPTPSNWPISASSRKLIARRPPITSSPRLSPRRSPRPVSHGRPAGLSLSPLGQRRPRFRLRQWISRRRARSSSGSSCRACRVAAAIARRVKTSSRAGFGLEEEGWEVEEETRRVRERASTRTESGIEIAIGRRRSRATFGQPRPRGRRKKLVRHLHSLAQDVSDC